MPEKAKLKICPFCGSKPFYDEVDGQIRCTTCHTISDDFESQETAFAWWNNRCGEQIAELDYLKKFARESYLNEELCRDQLRCLWTAYCLRYNFDVDTGKYDGDLRELWEVVVETTSDTGDWHDFETFDNFMCKYLV